MNTSKTIIIIPTYNEKENVVKMTQAIMGLDLELSILFVDENSPDGTSRCIADLVEKIPAQERINNRIEKFGKMGFWEETTEAQNS